MNITTDMVRTLREKTGAGILDCKNALTETAGDIEKAVDHLRKKGLALAAKKATRTAADGLVGSYIHAGGKIGVLIEINCETDFVARTPDFQALVKDLSMHVAASSPQYVERKEVPQAVLEKEREIYKAQAKELKKPENVVEKIVDGKMEKFYSDVCLLEQPFVKDPDKTVQQVVAELTAKIGEKLAVRRFVRFQLGEGIEKKTESLQEAIAKTLNS
ncbi:MAG: translation elongation factor Ts [Pseudomonadota bacterium]